MLPYRLCATSGALDRSTVPAPILIVAPPID